MCGRSVLSTCTCHAQRKVGRRSCRVHISPFFCVRGGFVVSALVRPALSGVELYVLHRVRLSISLLIFLHFAGLDVLHVFVFPAPCSSLQQGKAAFHAQKGHRREPCGW